MPTVSAARTIDAPLEEVWRIFTDLPTLPLRLSAVDAVVVLTDQPFGVGTTWRETRKMFGRVGTEELSVSALQVMQSYTVEAAAPSTHTTGVEFAATPDGRTAVIMTFTADVTGLRRVIWFLLQSKVRRELKRDLDELATFCELP